MNANEWVEFRAALALAGAGLVGFGGSFVAQPPMLSVGVALLGLLMLLTLAPSRSWIQLAGFTFLIAGTSGLLSIAAKWANALMTPEPQQDAPTGYLARSLLYALLLGIGWAERRHRRGVAVE